MGTTARRRRQPRASKRRRRRSTHHPSHHRVGPGCQAFAVLGDLLRSLINQLVVIMDERVDLRTRRAASKEFLGSERSSCNHPLNFVNIWGGRSKFSHKMVVQIVNKMLTMENPSPLTSVGVTICRCSFMLSHQSPKICFSLGNCLIKRSPKSIKIKRITTT